MRLQYSLLSGVRASFTLGYNMSSGGPIAVVRLSVNPLPTYTMAMFSDMYQTGEIWTTIRHMLLAD